MKKLFYKIMKIKSEIDSILEEKNLDENNLLIASNALNDFLNEMEKQFKDKEKTNE